MCRKHPNIILNITKGIIINKHVYIKAKIPSKIQLNNHLIIVIHHLNELWSHLWPDVSSTGVMKLGPVCPLLSLHAVSGVTEGLLDIELAKNDKRVGSYRCQIHNRHHTLEMSKETLVHM